jgi:hypothetical protein
VLGNECRSRVEDGIAHLAAMGLDRVVPELWNDARIRNAWPRDTLYCSVDILSR